MPSDKEKAESLISTGSEIAGTATGGAIGFLAGGPGGAAVGGALGVVISKGTIKLLSDISNRVLSKREEIRIGATAAFALMKIKSHLDDGAVPRKDGFFDYMGKKRSNAEEVFEGVLLKAKNEHEEKKAEFLGNIYANIAFFPGFSVGEANHLLQIAGNLTYRQMCILSLIEKKAQIQGIELKEKSYREVRESVLYETISILQETHGLHNLGLIVSKTNSQKTTAVLFGWVDIAPNRLSLTPMGKRYWEIMELHDIPEQDLEELARYLS
ncbi:MAG: hypothetical protein V3R93_06955 [Candidatus Hydrothermarchaeaceae archaeon]